MAPPADPDAESAPLNPPAEDVEEGAKADNEKEKERENDKDKDKEREYHYQQTFVSSLLVNCFLL